MSETRYDPAPLTTENGSLGIGILAGAAAAAAGAGLWAAVTVATGYQIGWMAVGIGFLVGFAVQKFGRGEEKRFGYAGALLSLLGCVAGNLTTVCVLVAREEGVPLGTVLAGLDPSLASSMLATTFSPIDLLFYGIAVYEGYRLSMRGTPVTKAPQRAA